MTKSEIYRIIQREYDVERADAEYDAEMRKRKVFQRLPKLKEINDEFANSGVRLAEIFLKGGDREKNVQAYKKRCAALRYEQTQLLDALGYPPDYFEPKYKCSKCKDTGYINIEKNRRLVKTERCDCFRKKLIKFYYAQSHIQDRIKEENFDKFRYDIYPTDVYEDGVSSRQYMENAVGKIMNLLTHIDEKPVNFYFSGNTGIGKTFMCNCIAKWFMDNEKSVIYMTSYNLFDTLVKKRLGKNGIDEEEMELLNDCDLLVIDDLGTEAVNAGTIAEFFNILNDRLLRNKSTIISSNLQVMELADIYSERILSRILGNFICYNFFGNDLRIIK